MSFEMIKEKYTGPIMEIELGKGDNTVKVGGETCLPFYQFEGEVTNKPKIAMEIWDMEPEEWPDAAREPFKDVIGDPAAWAKKCVQEYGADIICLHLRSTDPNEHDVSPEDAVAKVKKVNEAIDVPLIVWGTANADKDSEVLKKVAEDCSGENLIIGPIEDVTHKSIGAAVMGYGHTAVASSPIDINLAKQINILLENLGLPLNKILVDPTTGGLGYGLEYSYSVMERIKLAAMTFGDDKLQLPIINYVAFDVWKCKEAKQPVEEDPRLGDPERRAIMMETIAATTYLMAGSNVLILRHPETVRLVRQYIELLVEGGTAQEVAPIQKNLSEPEIDYASMSPEPDLTIEEAKEAPKAKKEEAKAEAPKEEAKEAPKEKAPKEEAKAEAPKEEAPKKEAPKEEAKAEAPKEEAKAEAAQPAVDESKLRAELEGKIRAEMEAKLRQEMESKAKAEESAEQKEEKAKKAAEEKAKKEAEAREKEKEKLRAQLESDEKEIRSKVKKLRSEQSGQETPSTPEKPEESGPERILQVLRLIHRRVA
ncbi:MAG: acetyl-CoA decarbonylase/synthase complex subunit delta [Desulfohalobiaceae bacterium]|nr:acetyl-CoA decarbonylase/synthase complex subunit delta [Desulfohalobiaceae bacterium]